MNKEHQAAIALNFIKGIGPAYAKRLVESAGTCLKVFEESGTIAEKSGVPAAYCARIPASQEESFRKAEQVLERAERKNIQVLALSDAGYPSQLREIPDPPTAIYTYGEAQAFNRVCIGVVGTRKATVAGKKFAQDISCELARSGITVVSGMALGIDGKAHLGALSVDNGATIAVLGCGVDIPYPSSNRAIYDKILKGGKGAIVSEYTPGTEVSKGNFPARNRIISGLSLGILVVEAPDRSGALITAQMALEQNRDVYAVPNLPGSFEGAGSNRLIRSGALLVERVEDILASIGDLATQMKLPVPERKPIATGDTDAAPLLELIRQGTNDLDELVTKSGFGISEVLSCLTQFEIEGKVKKVASNKWTAVTAGVST